MVTGTYKINDTELTIQPTTGEWKSRQLIDVDGNGHPVYPPYREYEMRWQLSNMTQVHQLQDFFDTIGRTGTVSVDLPRYAYDPYTFWRYSGTVIHEPAYGKFFAEHQTDVTLLITKIRIV